MNYRQSTKDTKAEMLGCIECGVFVLFVVFVD